MKWIGQNIYDNVALFRNNIRVGGGNIYGGDGSSNNWIMIDCQDGGDASGGGITFHEATLAADTPVDFDTPQYGAKIVYNEDDDDFSLGTIDNSDYKKQIVMNRGSTAVDFAGNITTAGTTNTFSSATTLKPILKIKNTTNDANASSLNFIKDKGAAGADGDDIGTILWTADNSAQEQTDFANIIAEVSEADDTDEAGKLTLNVAASDGTTSYLSPGLILEGEHGTTGEVDVTVGHRSGSTTTIAGTLTMGTTATLDNSGLLQVAGQTNITSVGTLTSLTTSGAIELGHANDTTIARSSAGIITVEGKEVRTIDRHLKIVHSAFKGDIGTTANYIPWYTEDENTSNTNENIPFIAPYAGKLLELHYRVSTNTSGATATWTLVQIEKTEVINTANNTTLDTQTCTGPTNTASGAGNLVKVTFDSDAAFNAGDMLALSIQHDSDVTSSSTKFYITTIWEYDLSSM